MVALTPELASGTLIFTLVYGVFAFGVTIYTLVLNRNQAKVKEQMERLITIMSKIEENTRKEEGNVQSEFRQHGRLPTDTSE